MAPTHHPSYSNEPLWSDISPIPLDEGPGPGPSLASIAYPPRYAMAMSYLRAVMAANEYSDRALSLTEDIISMNPAHYTVWLYRAKIIREMGKEVLEELTWLEGVSRRSLKNYQIWHHRQTMVSNLSSMPPNEHLFLSRILSLDSKNYHVWTYRQWLVNHFDLFDSPSEFSAVEALLDEDVRNNSAWNHRWFLCFGRDELRRGRNPKPKAKSRAVAGAGAGEGEGSIVVDEDLIDREVAFAQAKILLAPQNQSPWNYLRGLYQKSGRPLTDLRDFAQQFAGGDGEGNVEEGVRSSHALDLLADIYAEEGEVGRARRTLGALGKRWDPVRKGYWDYRARLLKDMEDEGGNRQGEEKGPEGLAIA